MNAYAASRYYQASQPAGSTLISMLLPLALHLIAALAAWKVLVKAGQPGWLALIPLANVFMLYKIAWGSGWYALLMLVPVVNFIVALMQSFKLARAFGKGGLFALGLLFLAPIFNIILGFDTSVYQGPLSNSLNQFRQIKR